MTSERILWYFADPMCSWCWGFSPVMSAIRDNYASRIKIALMLGGLRPGTTESVTAAFREEILHHWQEVHRRTGQPFAFEGAMPEGFVYDTEPPSRAVISVDEIDPKSTFPYFKSVQDAFYAHGMNVTQADVLAKLAEDHRVSKETFFDRFDSKENRLKTQSHFEITRQSGVRGFPTVLLQVEDRVTVLTHGYRSFEDLRPVIDRWLTTTE